MSYSIGIDYGTNSVRAIVVRVSDGKEIGTAVFDYPSGQQGILLDPADHNLARQHPGDYVVGLHESVTAALTEAEKTDSEFTRQQVVALGVDSTGSSPIPVDADNQALALKPEFKDNLSAQCWLWKDHTAIPEAEEITRFASEHRPHYLAKIGGIYSSEWFWAKIWKCLKVDPSLFEAAHSWVELCDYIPALLAGITDPAQVIRGVCAAGHKALYAEDWQGLPDKEFLTLLDPKLADLRDRLYEQAYAANETAGHLSAEWALKLKLPEGIPIAVGAFDVHYGAIGCGVEEGTLVKVIGTSTCDCGVLSAEKAVADIPGICGIVKGSILPGYYGIEAGQSAVGDIFKWWVEGVCEGREALHQELTQKAEQLNPGESGLLALDWNNGNRTVLVDQRLTGALLGQTLYTTRSEIYRALIEATAFGARAIIERLKEFEVPVNRIVCSGGIAEKSPLLMQIYADVTGCEMRVSRSAQSCALGSAITAAVVAGAHPSFQSAQAAMTGLKEVTYTPHPENQQKYNQLYSLYLQLHDSFGGLNESANLGNVMKDLLALKAGEQLRQNKKLMSDFQAIKEECCEANIQLPETGLVDLTFGNVSIADPARQVFAIKPSGVDYHDLTPDEMVVLDFEGKVIEGSLRPSSDSPTHRYLFLSFPGIRSVVHTHSRNAVSFAQAAREIPCLGTTHADYFFGNVPVSREMTSDEITSDYEWETGKVIVETFQNQNLDPLQIPAVLVRNHGPFAWGPSGAKAVETALALEAVAEMARNALQINPQAKPISQSLLEKHYLRKHGTTAYYGQK